MNIWDVKKPTSHMKKLCRDLGSDYSIKSFDLEQVIYRDFSNGYDLEISGMNTNSTRKKATLYLWKDAVLIIKKVVNVPQTDIGRWADLLCEKTLSLCPEDFGKDGFLKNEERTVDAESTV